MRTVRWLRLNVVVCVGTLLLSLPRWGHHTPDSRHYVALAHWLAGEQGGPLMAPFAYRLLAPAVACAVPFGSVNSAFALENVAWTAGAISLALLLMSRLGASRGELATAALLTTLSFPTVNYSSGVLSDPSALFFFVLGLLLIQSEQWLGALVVSGLGVLAREATVVLPMIAIVLLLASPKHTMRAKALRIFGFLLVPIAILLAVHLLMAEMGDVSAASNATPSLARLQKNLLRPVSWLTVGLTVGPIFVVLALRYRAALACYQRYLRRDRLLLISGWVAIAAVFAVGLVTAFMSGRFLWPLYPVLIPLVAGSLRKTLFERAADKLVFW